jgi:serine/threonine-protein kinase
MPEDTEEIEEFPTPLDRAFCDVVVEMGLSSRETTEAALALQIRCALSGKEVPSAPQLLVGQGMITAAQADRALAKLAEYSSADGPRLIPDAGFSDTSKKLPAMDDLGSLDDGPRIILPASALKEPAPPGPAIIPGPASSPAPAQAPAASGPLPPVATIEHRAEEPVETATVEIIMPTAGDTTVRAPETPGGGSAPPHPVPAQKPSSSEPISGYKLQSRLSTDETGTVFKAQQIAMDRLVALKVLPPKMTKDRSFVDDFLREARDAGQLNHPNLVRVHEVGRTGNYYFYSMELVQGQTLENSIKLGGRMPAARALQVAAELLRAVDHMAGKNVIHGEISPSTVVMTDEGAIKVLLARLGRARQNNTRFLLGDNYHYVAPERVLTDTYDVRADLYSVGAVLYYALTGQHPYSGANANQVLDQHFSAPVPNPKDVVPDLAADVARVVTRGMAKNRTERFGGPREMLEAIEAAQAVSKPRLARGTGFSTTRQTTQQTSTGAARARLQRRRRRRR